MKFAPASEISVIGAILIDGDAYAKAAAIVTPEMFADPTRRTFFMKAAELHAQGLSVDPATIVDYLPDLADRHVLIAEWLDVVPTAANVEYHARTVREAYLARRPAEIYSQAVTAYGSGSLTGREIEDAVARDIVALRELSNGGKRRRFLTAAEVELIPKPDFLIDDVLVRKSLAVLFGAPGSGKSFLALDWSLCIATGFRWFGREVVRGAVVYIAAEGSAGIGVRVRAWKANRRYSSEPPVYFLTSPAAFLDAGEADRIIDDIARELLEQPALIVVDTMSRCMPGADENSQADMSKYIAAIDRIRDATGATMLMLHHTNAMGERERGSTVLRGAADTMILIKADDSVLTIACEKQKDSMPFAKITAELEPLDDSAVIGRKADMRPEGQGLTPTETKVLVALDEVATAAGATYGDWFEVFDNGKKLHKSSFLRAKKHLLETGYVEADSEKRGARFRLTSKGTDALVAVGRNSVAATERSKVAVIPGGLESPRSATDVDRDYDEWELGRESA